MCNLTPTIHVKPEHSAFDSVIDISIANLPVHAHVILSAELKNEKGNPWFYSEAVFEANEQGMIHLTTDPSISGYYTGIDPMGLFWSMRPVDSSEAHEAQRGNEEEVYLTASIKDKVIATKTLHRHIQSLEIETIEINDHGFIGNLCYPKNAQNRPGIITLSGSGGGMSRDMARLLAAHGYTVLALAYFGMEGLPASLDNIHLEYFQNAIRWFKNQPQVDGQKIALRGASYGGELVLLLAATFPEDIVAVIAISPPSKIFGGFPYSNKPMWVYKNMPVTPYIGGLTSEHESLTEAEDLFNATNQNLIPFHRGTYDDPYEITPLFLARLDKYRDISEATAIPVENIRCPLLVISCEDDKVHPAQLHGQLIMERLDKYHSPIERKHIHFPSAGHSLGTPYEPKIDLPWLLSEGDFWCLSGGSIEGNYRAAKEGWQETLNFLEKTLR